MIIVGKEAIQCCLDQAAAKGALALDVSTIGSTGFDDGQVSSRPSAIGRIIVNQLWEMIGLSGVSAIAKQMTEAGRCCKTIISAAQPFRTLRLAWFYVHNGYDNCR